MQPKKGWAKLPTGSQRTDAKREEEQKVFSSHLK